MIIALLTLIISTCVVFVLSLVKTAADADRIYEELWRDQPGKVSSDASGQVVQP